MIYTTLHATSQQALYTEDRFRLKFTTFSYVIVLDLDIFKFCNFIKHLGFGLLGKSKPFKKGGNFYLAGQFLVLIKNVFKVYLKFNFNKTENDKNHALHCTQ